MNESIDLDCGCRMWSDTIDGVATTMFEPHAMDCEWYAYFVAESARQGKPVTTIDAR